MECVGMHLRKMVSLAHATISNSIIFLIFRNFSQKEETYMNKHRIFRELFNLPNNNEIYDFKELLDLTTEARKDFENVGVEFTYEGFIAYVKRLYEPRIQAVQGSSSSSYTDSYLRKLKIIEGDNLDKIEDAAIDKGLL